MGDCMEFPKTIDEFIDDFKFKDDKQVYTNGSELIQVFRVKQALEHYAAQPKWISVEDDRPANVIAPYLVYAYHRIYVADWSYDKWTDNWWFYVDGEHEPGVTHWMPLPEPPKEDV